jgi:hypothetical protein
MSKETSTSETWFHILKASAKIPGAKIDREQFLRKEFAEFCDEVKINELVATDPAKARIHIETLDQIAEKCIQVETMQASAISFAAGLPGGWWMAATIPADVSQFYYRAMILAQKLAYIYGWPDLFENTDVLSDEASLRLTLFMGVMMGSGGAVTTLNGIAKGLAHQAVKSMPQLVLNNIINQIAKWIGVKITKVSFTKGIAHVIPLIGGIFSAGLSAGMMLPMAKKLKKYLRNSPIITEAL